MAAPNAVITGWGSYAPPRVLLNKDLESMIDTTDTWIMERTGIRRTVLHGDGSKRQRQQQHPARRSECQRDERDEADHAAPPGTRR